MVEEFEFAPLKVDEKSLIRGEARRITKFLVVNEDGDILIKPNMQPGMPKLLAYMLGKVVAKRLGFNVESTITLGDISLLTGLRGEDLNKFLDHNRFVVYAVHGRYRLNTLFLPRILDELEKLYTSEINFDMVTD